MKALWIMCWVVPVVLAEIGFYPDIATATVRLPDIYIKVAEWKHTFALDPPCHDSEKLREHIRKTRDSVVKLRAALQSPLIAGGMAESRLVSSHRASLKQMIQFSKIILNRLERCELSLLDRITNAETLWGWSSSSLCSMTKDHPRKARSVGSAGKEPDDHDTDDESNAKHISKPNFYGAYVNQVFVQTDARRSDNRYMAAGSDSSNNDVFKASFREQELLRVNNARHFYEAMQKDRLREPHARIDHVTTYSRGDNLPNLNFNLVDEEGNSYHGHAEPVPQLNTYTSNVNFNGHTRMSHTPLRPVTDNHDAQTHSRRQRRGVDFIGEFYHWFAGLATDRQIREVLELIDKHGAQLNATANFVETNSKAIQSLSRTTAEEFQSLAKVITATQDALRQSSDVMEENLLSISDAIANNTREAELTQALLQTLIELTECDAKTSLLESSLTTSSEFYLYVSDGMVSGNLPLALVHTSRVVEVLKKIANTLPGNLALPPTILYDDMLSHIPIKMGVQAGKVIMIMSVPIIKKPKDYQTVQIVSHPMSIQGFWYKARILNHVYVVDGGSGEWISMSKENYQLCSRSPYGTCRINHVWSTNVMRDCGAHAVLRGDKIREVCMMDTVHDELVDHVFIAPIGINTWLITHNAVTMDLTVICRNGTKTDQVIKSLKSQTRLTLPQNCKAKIDGSIIEPTQDVLDAVSSESLVGDKYIFGPLPELTLDTVNIDVSTYNTTRFKRAFEIANLTAPQVAGSVAKLADLVARMDTAKTTYHSEMEMLAGQIVELREKVATDASAGWGFGNLFSGWKSIVSWVFGIIVFVLLIIIGLRVCKTCVCAPATLTAASMPLKGFALSVPENTTHLTIIDFGNITTKSTLVDPTTTMMPDGTQNQYVSHAFAAIFHYDLVIAFVFMMITIYWTRRFIMAEHRSMLARLGLFTKNLNIVHHMGESSLVIFFLVKSASLCGGSHRVFEIPIELCTLPGQALSWSCRPSHGYRPLVARDVVFHRFSRQVTIKLDFSHVSLTSSE